MKKFKHVIENYEMWESRLINFVKEFFGEPLPEFLDDTKTFYNQKQIYILFAKNYNNLIVRFDTNEKFINALQLSLIEYLPQLYVSTLAFVNNEFQKLLDEENRGDKQTGVSLGNGKQKNKQGIPPSNLTIKDDLANLNIKNAEFMENFNKMETSSQVTNLLGNLKQIINSKITSKIFDWLNNFNKLFTPLVKDEFEWNPQLSDILFDLKNKVGALEAIIDANRLTIIYNELQTQLSDLKKEIDKAIENATNQNIATLHANIKTLEIKFNDEIKKLWDHLDANDGLLQKFEELYNQISTEISQLQKVIDLGTIIRRQLPQEFFNNNTPVLRLTTNTSNDVGVANNSGKMLIGAKNGIEFTSSLNYTSDVAIRENNQLTTKKYVDDAINTITMGNIDWSNIRANTLSISNDNSLVGYDANKTEIRHNNNFIKLTNDGGVMEIDGVKVNIDSNQFNILASNDGTYQPTNPNSLINKNYIDTHFKNYVEGLIPLKLYTIVVNTTSHPFFKEDLKSNALWAYKTITEVSRQVTIPNSLIGKRVFWKVTLTRIYKNNQYVGVVNNYGITTPNTNNLQITMKANSNWFISGTDLNPGAGGRFNLDVYWLIEVFEVSNDGSTFLEETK